MKLLMLLVILALIIGCTKTVDLSNDQTFDEPVTEQPEQADDYTDIQTAEDDFNAIEETLDLLP